MRFMMCAVYLVSLAGGLLAQGGAPAALTLDGIAASAEADDPSSAVWSPDSRYLVHSVRVRSFGKEIVALDAATGRARLHIPQTSLRVAGWIAPSNALVCADDRSIAIVKFPSGRARTLLVSTSPISNVQPAPNGKWIAFTRANTLFLLESSNGRVHPVSSPGSDQQRMGVLDPTLAREFHQKAAYWWSPDSSSIAWLETSEPNLPLGHSEPFSGEPTPTVRVLITKLGTSQTRHIDTGLESNRYLPRVQWLPDSKRLAIQRLNREQTLLELLIAQASTGASNIVLQEKDPYWININDDLTFVNNGERFLWSSERSGYRHLYLYTLDSSRPPLQLTNGLWEVTNLVHVDERKQIAYYTSTQASPVQRQLYSIRLDGTSLARITQKAGTHVVTFSPDGNSFLDTFSTATSAPCQTIKPSERPDPAVDLGCLQISPTAPDALSPVNFFRIKTQDGMPIDAMMIKPPGFDPNRRYPVIIYTKAGPGQQGVLDAWGGWVSLWHQFMTAHGFIVFAADTRGAAGHGHVFEEPLHYRLGAQEISDMRDAVHYLRTLPYIDSKRLCVWGTQYGGFLALHALFKDYTDFYCAAAVAPITDLHRASAIFSERYLGLFASHRNEFEESAPLEAADRLKGKLLLASAPGATLELERKLASTGKPFEKAVLSTDSSTALAPKDLEILLPRLSQFFLTVCSSQPPNPLFGKN